MKPALCWFSKQRYTVSPLMRRLAVRPLALSGQDGADRILGPTVCHSPGQSSARSRGPATHAKLQPSGGKTGPSAFSLLCRQAAATRSARSSHKLKRSSASGSGAQVFKVDFPSRKERHK